MDNNNLELYKTIYLIRTAEEKIREYYNENEIKTPVHLCIGEEAISAGVCSALKEEDQVLCTYRSHGVYLARTNETDKFFGELYGRVSGSSRGKAGSMHITSPEDNFLGASAVVATPIPVAVGCALANKMQKNGKIVAVFFGDGAIDEGVFWESLNFACLKELPILFICEDNGLAIHSRSKDRHGYNSLTEIVKQFKCNVFTSNSTDVEKIFQLTRDAIEETKKNNQPSLLYMEYYRYYEHVGINYDFQFGYRSQDELTKWMLADPIKIQREKLLKSGSSENELEGIEKAITNKIENSINKARQSPQPPKNALYEEVFDI